VLHEDLGFSQFIPAIHHDSKAYMETIVTMEKTMVSEHMPENKRQSKRWLKKGKSGPIKAKVQASSAKHLVIAFFNAKGLIYTSIVSRGKTFHADHSVKTLQRFLVVFKKKRPNLAATGWRFHWDNAPVHTAAKVHAWFAANAVKVIKQATYSPDLAPTDFFLFPKVKEGLTGHALAGGVVEKAWEGVTAKISGEEFANAFCRWFER